MPTSSPSSDDEESNDGDGLFFVVGFDLLPLALSTASDGDERLMNRELDSVSVLVSVFACFRIDE